MAEARQRFEQNKYDGDESSPDELEGDQVGNGPWLDDEDNFEAISDGTPLETILNICPQPPRAIDMANICDKNVIFMIAPFNFDPTRPQIEPTPINSRKGYQDRWDGEHVRMPCSPYNTTRDRRSKWPILRQIISELKKMCDNNIATSKDLINTIENCVQRGYDMSSLEKLINNHYSNDERSHFMSTVLSNICNLALHVDTICSRPPPLLRAGRNQSVTMSQLQAASLLACEFFCLFPYRSDRRDAHRFGQFPKLNFHRLYSSGPPKKIEKLKCILNYFRRITEIRPTGVITIQRVSLPSNLVPKWSRSQKGICDIHLTTGKRIEEVYNVLQVDFANKFIGGGVLTNGCVQEEIRFAICPEMLVSLLVCEVMEPNECIFLIGCEQYSLYKGYADSFKFNGHYEDTAPKDNWGRKWCHLLAIDAIYFKDPSKQYSMECTDRELLKAYTGFHPHARGPQYEFGIATGSWGCGAFHGDRQLKAIIQLMAASEAGRPLIYACYRDRNLVTSFAVVLQYLKTHNATVGDLYLYLQRYFAEANRGALFEYILATPLSSVKSKD